jgi:hypothetical protein
MSMFGLQIDSDGLVTQKIEWRVGDHSALRSKRLRVPHQRIYFSRVGPVSWEPMQQATIRTMNDSSLS